ncbi:unnamed protein product [Prunus armeniaca]|uniref:Uncharacterized protein n=1 Tax=Prunus armeniaca TaxID=36596 RepID=A0A6J5Y6I5_PRUAR|nr:unnamed protein product [Prunus armeniaca]
MSGYKEASYTTTTTIQKTFTNTLAERQGLCGNNMEDSMNNISPQKLLKAPASRICPTAQLLLKLTVISSSGQPLKSLQNPPAECDLDTHNSKVQRIKLSRARTQVGAETSTLAEAGTSPAQLPNGNLRGRTLGEASITRGADGP